MKLRPITMEFPYLRTFVPRRCRNERTEVFKATATGAVRSVTTEEASNAFRISFPERDARKFYRPRSRLGHASHYLRSAAVLTVIRYDDTFWWPIRSGDGMTYPGTPVCVERCLQEIEQGWTLRDIAPVSKETPAHSGKAENARSSISDGHDAALAMSQRKIYENFLICGRRIYVRGGPPVYVKRPYWKSIWEIDVADSGFDRAIDPLEHGLDNGWDRRHDEEAFRSGEVWLADQRAAAEAAVNVAQLEVPLIEVLMPEPIADVRVQVRVDAFVRETLEMFRQPFCDRWNAKRFLAHRKRLLSISGREGDDRTITSRRLNALRTFFGRDPRCDGCSHLAELKADFKRFIGGNMPTELPLFDYACMQIINDNGLSAADQDAISSIAV